MCSSATDPRQCDASGIFSPLQFCSFTNSFDRPRAKVTRTVDEKPNGKKFDHELCDTDRRDGIPSDVCHERMSFQDVFRKIVVVLLTLASDIHEGTNIDCFYRGQFVSILKAESNYYNISCFC